MTSVLRPRMALATVLMLFLSTLIPIWAAIPARTPPAWLPMVDLVLAAALVMALAVLHGARKTVTVQIKAMSYDTCRWIAVIPLVLFLVYAVGTKLKWDILLIGLGWRGWYLITVMPLLLAARGPAGDTF